MTKKIFPEDPIELKGFLERLGLWNDTTQAIYLDLITQPNNKKLYEEYQAMLMPDVFERLEKFSPFSPADEKVDGRIRFATTEQDRHVGIDPHECHMLMAGQTGCGKSTLLRLMFSNALQLEEYQTPESSEKIICWLFAKAQDMRSLLNVDKNILVATFNEIKLNPLEPPEGVKPIDWTSVFADLWIQAFWLHEGSKGFLIESLHVLYEKHSERGTFPSLYDLYYYVKAQNFPAHSRYAGYRESIINRLGGLIKGSLSGIFDCSRGHAKDLIKSHAIFEILYLTSEQQIFIVNYLLSYLFHYKLKNETNLRHWAGIDDANLIFDVSYEKRHDLGLPIIHHLLTTVRKNKINIFACTQTPHQLGASIHSNSFAKIMFSLSHGKDIEHMFQSMGIKDAEQKKYCFKLEPRKMVVKFSARYQEPFVATVPELKD